MPNKETLDDDSGRRGRDRPRGKLSRFETGRARRDAGAEADELRASPGRVRVDDRGVSRPFMRGILVHSLTERGFDFEAAYAISQEVWKQVRDREIVSTKDLRELVDAQIQASDDAGPARYRALDEPLQVVGRDGRWPFSQARLQQSFLAAGIEPRLAFEAVVELERSLRQGRTDDVTRDEIRTLAGAILERRFGEEAARRYHAWRKYQNEDDRPVIVLLGGTSGVGKSSLGLEVARRLSIARVLSTDSVRDVMRVMVSEELVPTLHVSSFEAHSRLVGEVPEGLDPVIEGFLEQSQTISVGVRAVIERAITEGMNMVLDGVSLVPGLFDVEEWRDRAHVFFVLAADEDRESLHGHLVARAHGKGARASARYMQNFQEIFRIQEDLLERAELSGVPVVDVHDLESAAHQVVSYVVDRLAEERAAEATALD